MPQDNEEIKLPKRPRRNMGPGSKFVGGEKANNFGSAIKSLMLYAKNWLPGIIVASLLAVCGCALNLAGPGKLSEITDLIAQGIASSIDVAAVVKIAIILTIIYSVAWLCNFLQNFVMATVTQRLSKKLRTDISLKIDKLPLKYFDGTSVGNVMSRISNDVDMIGQTLNQSLGALITAFVMFFGSLFCMFTTNWILALSGVGASILGFSIMLVIIKKSQKYFNQQQQSLGSLNGHIEETYSGHAVVKAYTAEDSVKKEFRRINNELYNCAWKSQFLSGLMQPLMGFVGNLGYVVVCVVGAVLTINGIISFGVIVAFMVYVRQFTQPLSQFAQAANSLQSAAAASERIFEILNEDEMETEKDNIQCLDNVAGAVRFEHVRFGYDPEDIIIQDFSADVKPGQKVAIVGPTGAGKTTLINLLMRFYELQGGKIYIDGIETTKLSRQAIHDQFCMVLQDAWIFEGTIRENIVYSKEGVTDEEVINACKAVGLHHFIQTLPKGYETVLNDSSALSAGQRQLVTIARAMIKNAPMLILDEATSSVDTRTEQLIQQSMDTLMVGRTSFVIAHRLSTIKNADKILVLNHGEIVEQGNHEELLAKGGFYATLYNSQFEE
ncbi:ABC transporter ATP-binding protein [Phoenicibacter congonensis]|uniref:ABC transporter ATP-binding protein n=1 Tax=Phoenicibacter congonensis TaxID=1944646 RepID=UPI0009A8C51F|nr:ABC transporter ATP-binding protein [Phoenicibacter congonensis]